MRDHHAGGPDSTQPSSATVETRDNALASLTRFCMQFKARDDRDLEADRTDRMSTGSDAMVRSQSGNSDNAVDTEDGREVGLGLSKGTESSQLTPKRGYDKRHQVGPTCDEFVRQHSVSDSICISNAINKQLYEVSAVSAPYDLAFTGKPLAPAIVTSRSALGLGETTLEATKRKLTARNLQKQQQQQSWRSTSATIARARPGYPGTSAESKTTGAHYSNHSPFNMKMFAEHNSQLVPFGMMSRNSTLLPTVPLAAPPTGYAWPLPPPISTLDFANSRSPFRRLTSTAETLKETDSSSLLLGASLRQLFASTDHTVVPDYCGPVRQRPQHQQHQGVRYDFDPTTDLSFGRKLAKLSRFDPLRRFTVTSQQTATSPPPLPILPCFPSRLTTNNSSTFDAFRTQLNSSTQSKFSWYPTNHIKCYNCNDVLGESSGSVSCATPWSQPDPGETPFSFYSHQLVTPSFQSTPCSAPLSALIGRTGSNMMSCPLPVPAVDGRHSIQTTADGLSVSQQTFTMQQRNIDQMTFENLWECGNSVASSKPYLSFGFI